MKIIEKFKLNTPSAFISWILIATSSNSNIHSRLIVVTREIYFANDHHCDDVLQLRLPYNLRVGTARGIFCCFWWENSDFLQFQLQPFIPSFLSHGSSRKFDSIPPRLQSYVRLAFVYDDDDDEDEHLKSIRKKSSSADCFACYLQVCNQNFISTFFSPSSSCSTLLSFSRETLLQSDARDQRFLWRTYSLI